MPQITVDESAWLSRSAVDEAVSKMLAHPKARKMVLQAQKMVNPEAVIPELDAAEPINSELAEVKRMIAEEAAARRAEAEARNQEKQLQQFQQGWERQKAQLRQAGWQDQGITAIEKFAHDNGIGDLSIAADAWERRNPPPSPETPNGAGGWNFFDNVLGDQDDKFVEKMIASRGEDEAALNAEINATLKEYRAANGVPGRR